MSRSSVIRILLGGVLVLLIAFAVRTPGITAPAPELRRAVNVESGESTEMYLAERDTGQNGESDELMAIGDYWYHRVSYPTGQFNPAWVREAAAQDSQVERAVPAGEVIYGKNQNESPLALNANRFTSLGPQPLQSNGCLSCYSYGLVAGRTNVMAIDPVSTNVAYLGADGGGV